MSKKSPKAGVTRESLGERARVLTAQIKTLPTSEVFRIVADFIDTKQWRFASQTAAYAVNRLERERPVGGDAGPRLELLQ